MFSYANYMYHKYIEYMNIHNGHQNDYVDNDLIDQNMHDVEEFFVVHDTGVDAILVQHLDHGGRDRPGDGKVGVRASIRVHASRGPVSTHAGKATGQPGNQAAAATFAASARISRRVLLRYLTCKFPFLRCNFL